ncbi:unnamed protein product [Paramecium pentaurelia]|uniref:HTH myb-type domain-containing protein n=1 Tax=Paramecium pentaurelia TaxID=43138 RepID=A0A8S1X4I8_9CILI|nr:unnamed protein product [Paramecium pentaurelia]
MDEGIYIKQVIVNDMVEISDQILSQNAKDESLEHLYNSIIQHQSKNGQSEYNEKESSKKKLNDLKFSFSEDKRILELVQQVGPNFNSIVKYFPGKTMNMIKNRYYKKLRYIKDDYLNEKEKGRGIRKQRKTN